MSRSNKCRSLLYVSNEFSGQERELIVSIGSIGRDRAYAVHVRFECEVADTLTLRKTCRKFQQSHRRRNPLGDRKREISLSAVGETAYPLFP